MGGENSSLMEKSRGEVLKRPKEADASTGGRSKGY